MINSPPRRAAAACGGGLKCAAPPRCCATVAVAKGFVVAKVHTRRVNARRGSVERRVKLRGALCGVLAATALVGGCARTAREPDTLRLVVPSPAEAVDPRFTTSAIAQRLSFLVHAPLLYIADDLTAQPLLAETFRRIDEVTWEAVLRSDAQFSDGTSVTADDIQFTFGTLGDDDVRSVHAAKFKRIVRIDVVDARTARFVLDAPFAAFPLDLCSIGILSAKDCRNDTAGCRTRHVASGPFEVETFDPANERMRLKKNPHWRNGETALGGVEVRVVKDGTTRLLELMDGKADLMVGDLDPVQLDVVADQESLTLLRQAGLGYSYLAMNLRGPRDGQEDDAKRSARALASPQVRRAIANALDIDRVIATKLRGAATRATGMLPSGHWAKDAALVSPTYDPAEAERLLDAAGFPRRDDGMRFAIQMSTTTNRLRRSLALIFADQLKTVGIDVEVRVGEWATLYADIKRGNFEMFSAKWTQVVEPDLFHWVFHSASIPGENAAGGNRGAFVDEDVDRWIEEGRTLQDVDARKVPYQKVERRLLETLPYIPLWFEDEIAVVGPRVKGFALNRSGAFFGLATTTMAPVGDRP